MKQPIRASVYRQATIARLAEAEYLKVAHPSGAIYLGGYTVEYMLKWAICRRYQVIYLEYLPDQKTTTQLTGARGHDLDFLLAVTRLRPLLKLDHRLQKAFNGVLSWERRIALQSQSG